jgi:thiosulfate/3-mercaptopyruvate sulfurtransferase
MTGPLVSALELARALDDARPPVLLDVRWALGDPDGEAHYAEGHLPGAVYVDLDRELAAPPGRGGRHPLPAPDAFTQAMRAKGVSAGRPVVAYDGGAGLAAARAWWLLRYYGHPHVAVLDGGLAAWSAAGLALTREVPRPPEGDFSAVPGGMPVLDAAGAERVAASGVLLDARAAERYRGDVEPIDPVAGHIPGARSHPAAATVDGAGRFRSREALRAGFAAHDIGATTVVGAYCGSGVTAAHTVLAAELAGIRAALYAGSWSDWITDPARPVARG